jgi:hypothetical protein
MLAALKLLVGLPLLLLLGSCPQEGPLERAGENIEDAVDDVRDGVEDVIDDIDDELR